MRRRLVGSCGGDFVAKDYMIMSECPTTDNNPSLIDITNDYFLTTDDNKTGQQVIVMTYGAMILECLLQEHWLEPTTTLHGYNLEEKFM